MPPLGRIFEAPSLTPEEQALKDTLHNKGRALPALMIKPLPDIGPLSLYKTEAVERRTAMNG